MQKAKRRTKGDVVWRKIDELMKVQQGRFDYDLLMREIENLTQMILNDEPKVIVDSPPGTPKREQSWHLPKRRVRAREAVYHADRIQKAVQARKSKLAVVHAFQMAVEIVGLEVDALRMTVKSAAKTDTLWRGVIVNCRRGSICWKILDAIRGREQVRISDLTEKVWGKKSVATGSVYTAISRTNEKLRDCECRWRLTHAGDYIKVVPAG